MELNLLEIRDQLDVIDNKIEELFIKRMQLCGDVAVYKYHTGKAVYDAAREQSKIDKLVSQVETEFDKEAVKELFLQMMTISRRFQYGRLAEMLGNTDNLGFEEIEALDVKGKKIAYQGLPGAYGHIAAVSFFGEDADIHHVDSFEDLVKEIQEGKADYSVIPIENSTAGAVSDNFDLLAKYDNYIVAEISIPINHCLLGTEDAELDDIVTVYAHPQALAQSDEYLKELGVGTIDYVNNAVAAKKIADDKDKSQAAIASELAGKLYGLKVLKEGINNSKDNATRFVIMSRKPVFLKNSKKITIAFELPHTSGSLYNILGNFFYNNVNLNMLVSRPMPGHPWEYRFYADLEGNLNDPGVRNSLYGVFREAQNCKIIGNY